MNWKDNFCFEKKYFETEKGILYNDDCLNTLLKIPDNSIDLIITDPPYNISEIGKRIIRSYNHYNWKSKCDINLDFGEWDRCWETEKDFFDWIEKWFKECIRVLKDEGWIYIFFDKQRTGYFDLFLAPKYNVKARTIYVWVKSNPVPSFRKVNWNSGTEHIWVGTKGSGKIKNFLRQNEMMNYFICPNASAWKKTNHPTEKPVALLERLVLVNSKINDIVLDPFFGSGSLSVACEFLNRNWIGIEKSEEYCFFAQDRILKEMSQLNLF